MNMFNIYTKYDSITFLACNDITDTLKSLNSIGIDTLAIDYDPKFKNNDLYTWKDFIFDDIQYSSELVVHMNCEKTYPEVQHCGDVLLRGDDLNYHGDCNPVESTQQLIKQFNLKEIYREYVFEGEYKNHYLVWGKI